MKVLNADGKCTFKEEIQPREAWGHISCFFLIGTKIVHIESTSKQTII
jgi:hypothetical protein